MTLLITSHSPAIRRFAAATAGLWIVLGALGAVALVVVEAPHMLEEYTAHE